MKIAIVDDEKIYTDKIAYLCHDFETQNGASIETSCFVSGKAFLDSFQAGVYQVVFMDIIMEGINGIETAHRLREKDHDCFLVFLTSTGDFMPEAFSFHAYDYIVKPFTRQRVFQLLLDVKKHLPELPPYIEIISNRQSISLLLSDIISVISNAHYLNIHTKDGRDFRSRMTLGTFLHLTKNAPCFLSVNRGILVNADYVDTIDKKSCIMTDGTSFPIRVRDSKKIKTDLLQYHFAILRERQLHRYI